MKNLAVENKKLWLSIKPGKTPSSVKIDNDFWKFFNPGEKLLDVGCGWGRTIFECQKKRLLVVGVDINKNEIDNLRKKKFSGVKLICGDILKVKLEKGFNGAFALGVLSALLKTERKKALKKIRNSLVSGGYVHICEFEFSKKFKNRYDKDFKTTKEYGTVSAKESGIEIFRGHNFTKSEILDLIKSSGFKIIKFKRTEFISYHKSKKPGMMIIAKKI